MSRSIPAVIPPSHLPGPDGVRSGVVSRDPLPLPTPAPRPARSCVYAMAAVDHRGRLADRTLVRAMRWSPGVRLQVRHSGGVIHVLADDRGVFAVPRSGYVHLPLTVRRWCHLVPGDRVLLVGEPDANRLAVYPPACLDSMIARLHSEAGGGEAP